MKNLAYTLSLPILLFLVLSGTKQAYATHSAGMEMFYRHITGNTYEFTGIFYRNCRPGAAGPPATLQLRAQSASLGYSSTNVLNLAQLPTFGQGVPKLQPENLYNCTKSTLCYEEYVYRGTLNLNNLVASPLAKDWIFAMQVCCRPGPGGIYAADNIEYDYQYIECGLNNLEFPEGNNSPFWHNLRPNHPGNQTDTVTNFLMRTMCTDNLYTFDQSVREYDGDTVIYTFSRPLGQNGAIIDYIAGSPYSFTNPFPFYATPGFRINDQGIISVRPSPPVNPADNIYVISIKATEYRRDTVIVNSTFTPVLKEIGFVKRDMTLFIDGPTTCRRDFVHPYPDRVDCGDSVLFVRFRADLKDARSGSRVRCETIAPDGSDFRFVDSSTTPARSISILGAEWKCGSGQNTGVIKLPLAEKLHWDGEYYLFTKKGTDLDVLESECGFLEPEFSGSKIRMKGSTPVDLDLPPAVSICLPTTDPFPLLKGASDDAVQYHWTFNGDTIPGQEIDSIWAQEQGTYQVLVRGPWGCPGSDQVDVYFPYFPEFDFDLPPYCDTIVGGDKSNLPALLTLPSSPSGGTWEWEYDFGPPNGFDIVKSGDSLLTIGPGKYKLKYQDTAIAPGIPGCVTEFEFDFTRESHPPEQPLNAFIEGNPVLCEVGGDNAVLFLIEDKIKPNFKAKPGYPSNLPYEYQWFQGNLNNPIPNAEDSAIVRSEQGTYYVHVKDQYGCVGLDSVTIERIPKTPSFEIFCNVIAGKRGRFSWGQVENATAYEVSIDDGLTWIPVDDQFYEVEDIRVIGEVKVRAVIDNVCKLSHEGTSFPCAADVFPPNVFTPNKDGLNDFFTVGSLDLFPESTIKVFDRWGTIVFESDDYKNDWDGGDASEGTYYYIINVNDPAESVYKGVVTLLR